MKWNIKIFSIAGLFFIFGLSSCFKSIKCPGYNYPAFNEWLPYKNGDIVNFSNGAKKARLTITKSQAFAAKRDQKDGGVNGKVCERSYWIEGDLKIDNITTPYKLSVVIEMNGLEKSYVTGNLHIHETFQSVYFDEVTSAGGFKNSGLTQDDINNRGYFAVADSVSFGAKSYNTAQALIFKMANRQFDDLYFAKSDGLVAFKLSDEGTRYVIY